MSNIFIAMPCYQSIDSECVVSLFANMQSLADAGHKVRISFENNNSLIEDARNHLVERFMESNNDIFIFMDSDVSANGDAMLKLIRTGKDMVGGVYPKKNTEDMGDRPNFPCEFEIDPKTAAVYTSGECLEAKWIPTGFMLIRRKIFEKFKNAYPDRQYKKRVPVVTDKGVEDKIKDYLFGYFATGTIDGVFYGEDVNFCKKVKEMGEKIYVYPNINFKHIGRKAYFGNLNSFLVNSLQIFNESKKEKENAKSVI